MITSIKHTSQEAITVEPTVVRQTPPDAKAKFGEALKQSAMVLLGAATGVASVLPAGGILSAAIRTGAGLATSPSLPASSLLPASPSASQGSLAATGGSEMDQMWQLQQQGVESSLEVLKIQEAISQENRVFSTLSNVLKARHETARTAINNIR